MKEKQNKVVCSFASFQEKLFSMTIGRQPQRNVPCVWSIAYHLYEIVGRQL